MSEVLGISDEIFHGPKDNTAEVTDLQIQRTENVCKDIFHGSFFDIQAVLGPFYVVNF